MKLLIVEDNQRLLDAIKETLTSEKFLCETADDFDSAYEKISIYEYDVIIVDINLPGGSGLELIRKIKDGESSPGIVVISARNLVENKIEGLDLGADDYVTKPFHMAELVARIKAIMRRRNFSGSPVVTIGRISINTISREVKAGGRIIELTKSEYAILLFFFSNPNRALTRESIAEHIWGDNMDLADSFDFIYSHIKNLRRKLTASGIRDPIKAIYGIGYQLDLT